MNCVSTARVTIRIFGSYLSLRTLYSFIGCTPAHTLFRSIHLNANQEGT